MSDPEQKRIVVLIGPKGAGKTYLGARIEAELGVPFVRVEPIWLALAQEMPQRGPDFDEEGQRRVLAELARRLAGADVAVMESTGTAPWFDRFLRSASALGTLVLVRVRAPPELCLERVRTRDASNHIPVSDERVAQINEVAERLELDWSLETQSTSLEQADAFLRAFGAGLRAWGR